MLAAALFVSTSLAMVAFVPAPVGAQSPPDDTVPESWVLGSETIDGQQLDRNDRIRVLPGAKLTVQNSVLNFGPNAGGFSGIVAEPGSEVAILNSTIESSAPGAFRLHFEGDVRIVGSTIRGAHALVLQPRSLTDYVDEAAGASLQGRIPGWRLARTFTNGSALLKDSLVEEGTGVGLVVGAPIQYRATVGAVPAAVRLEASTVHGNANSALSCYATQQSPDPDSNTNIPVLAVDKFSQVDLVDTTLDSESSPVLRCPPAPVPELLPSRNVPAADPVLMVLNALLPPSPAPEAVAGPQLVKMTRGLLEGSGVGALLDASTRLETTSTEFRGLDGAVRVAAVTASARLQTSTGTDLDLAFDVQAGSLEVQGGTYEGPGGTGAHKTGGTLLLNAATLRDFGTCAFLDGSPATITANSFVGCGTGVLLNSTTGATVNNNAFFDNLDPLRVESPTTASAHFAHTVNGNTVHGLALSYVRNANGLTVNTAVGHVVVSFSTNVVYNALDLAHGTWHVVASSEVVLGAAVGKTSALAEAIDPELAPVFDRVWHNVSFEIYPGSLRGPQGTLDENVGNDLDQAAALVKLLRDAGRTARFVDGRFTITKDAYLNWVHMENPNFAFGMHGFEGQWFGATALMDRTWVETEIATGVWVSLDPAFQQYTYTAPIDVAALAGVDFEQPFADAVNGSAIDYATHSIANVDIEAAFDALESNNETLAAYIDAHPELADMDLLGGAQVREILASEEPTNRVITGRFQDVPADRMWSVRIRTLEGGVDPAHELDFTGTTPEIYGKKISVESAPSDEAEGAQLAALGGLYEADRTQIQMTTMLYLGSELVAADGAIPQPDGTLLLPEDAADRPIVRNPGDLVNFLIEVRMPGGQVLQVKNSPIRIGGTYAVALEIGRTSAPLLERLGTELQASLDLVRDGPTTNVVPNHELFGDLYYYHGLSYFGMVRAFTEPLARLKGVVVVPGVSVAVTGTSLSPITKFNATQNQYVPTTFTTPPYIDVQGTEFVYPQDGNQDRATEYLFTATLHGSNMEDKVFAGLYGTPSVSTVKVLAAANAQGVRIYHLNASEANDVLPHLDLPQVVLDSIVEAVNNGFDVVTPGTEVSYLNWTGVGWIEYNVETGASGFLIYGGTAPPTNAGSIVPQLINGGSGAQYQGYSDNPGPWYDLGYAYGDQDVIDWSATGLGAVLDWGEASTYHDFNDASRLYRGKALNNAQRSLASDLAVDPKTGKFLGRASVALTVGLDGIELYEAWNDPTRTTEQRNMDVAGLAAIDIAELAVGGLVVAKGAGVGAAIGGVIGDGPGVVVGAVVGGLAAAVATGILFDGIKGAWLGR